MKRKKILITVAPVARIPHPDPMVDNPLKPEEIAKQVIACEKAGAGQAHFHVRKEDGSITHEIDVYSRTLDLIREQSNILIQGSTGGFEKELTLDQRCSAIDDSRTQTASLNMGSLNFGHDIIFQNPECNIEYWAQKFFKNNVIPDLEIFDRGMFCTVERFLDKNILKMPLNLGLALGYHTGMQSTMDDLLFMKNYIPKGSHFGIAHNAYTDFSLIAASIAVGAQKIRVGLEDSIYWAPGEKVKDNVEMVERAVEMLYSIGCEPMSSEEAKKMYGVKR